MAHNQLPHQYPLHILTEKQQFRVQLDNNCTKFDPGYTLILWVTDYKVNSCTGGHEKTCRQCTALVLSTGVCELFDTT